MKSRLAIGLAAAVLTSLAFGSVDGVTLKLSPKVGDTLKYHQVAKLDFNGMEIEFSATSTHKVLKVEANGDFSTKEEMSEMKLNGQDAPDGAGPAGSTMTLSAKGELLKIEGERVDESAYRNANLSLFVYPEKALNAGDTWSYEIKENKTTGAVAAKADYTFVGEEKVGESATYKVKYVTKETASGGASSEGFLWLRKSDNVMLKLTAKWTNVPIAGAGPISGDVTVTLVQ